MVSCKAVKFKVSSDKSIEEREGGDGMGWDERGCEGGCRGKRIGGGKEEDGRGEVGNGRGKGGERQGG